MPAMLDDPTRPTIYRTSGEPPFPSHASSLPPDVKPRQVTLRDRITTATLVPFSSPADVPAALLSYLADQLNQEIELGDTYPMIDPMPVTAFGPYWFSNFGAVMVVGDIKSAEEVTQMEKDGCDWTRQCLGSFYIKPNYPGRSSHVCNAGFLVTEAARNRGVGRLMGEGYIEWAPKLGYTYSVFNLVYETNVASCRIWDALGFKRIGRVPRCGNLRSYPGQLIDAIIYGRALGQEDEEPAVEERFDKIRYYLKHGQYPDGADRAEKSRLRSAATHYRLTAAGNGEPEKLMLKGKEVVADAQRQYELAKTIHEQNHGGINKTTAIIAEKYHWIRIKETVSVIIKNCKECKEPLKPPSSRPDGAASGRNNGHDNDLPSASDKEAPTSHQLTGQGNRTLSSNSSQRPLAGLATDQEHHDALETNPQNQAQHDLMDASNWQGYGYDQGLPVDPCIMDGVEQHFPLYHEPTLHRSDHDRLPSPLRPSWRNIAQTAARTNGDT